MERTPAWGIEPVPERLRVLGLLDNALLWGNLGVSLLVLVAGTYLVPALSLPEACRRNPPRQPDRKRDARRRGDDRRGRARARDGADAGTARPAGIVGADSAQRGPVRRLVDLRAADHRDRRRRALGRGARLPCAVALDAPLRRDRAGACPARADRLRPQVHPQVRGVGGARLVALPDVVVARRRGARRPLEAGR